MPRLLFVSAPSTAQPDINTLEELVFIEEAIGEAHCKIVPDLSKDAFGEKLEAQQSEILHLSAHGTVNGKLVVEHGIKAELKVIDAHDLAVYLENYPSLKLVVFCVCNSDSMARKVAGKIPAAIGFPGQLSDRDAKAFTKCFYQKLASGKPDVYAAYEHAISELYESSETQPRLYFNERLSSINWDGSAWIELLKTLKDRELLDPSLQGVGLDMQQAIYPLYDQLKSKSLLFRLRDHLVENVVPFHPEELKGFEKGLARDFTSQKEPRPIAAVDQSMLKQHAWWKRIFQKPRVKLATYRQALQKLECLDVNAQEYFLEAVLDFWELHIRNTEGKKANLLHFLTKQLYDDGAGAQRRYLFLGGSGSGKTIALVHTFLKLATQQSRFAVVYAPLYDMPFEQLQRLDKAEKARTILLLDGVDELLQIKVYKREEKVFDEIEGLMRDFGKVVVCSRPEVFDSEKDEKIERSERYPVHYEVWRLEPLEMQQVQQYLLKHYQSGEEAYRLAMGIVKGAGAGIFQRPMLLRYLPGFFEPGQDFAFFRVNANLETEGLLTHYEVFDQIIRIWLEREAQRIPVYDGDYTADLWEAMLQFAEAMYRTETKKYVEGSTRANQGYIKAAALEALETKVGADNVKFAGIVHRYKDGRYRFAHSAFKEYFYAQLLYEGRVQEKAFLASGGIERYQECWQVYAEMSVVKYYQRLRESIGKGYQPNFSTRPGRRSPFGNCAPLYWFDQEIKKWSSDTSEERKSIYLDVYDALLFWTGRLTRAQLNTFAGLAAEVVTKGKRDFSEQEVLDMATQEGGHILALNEEEQLESSRFFFSGDQHGRYSFLHRVFAEFFLIREVVEVSTNTEELRDEWAYLPHQELRFTYLFEQPLKWLRFWDKFGGAGLKIQASFPAYTRSFEDSPYHTADPLKRPKAFFDYFSTMSQIGIQDYTTYQHSILRQWGRMGAIPLQEGKHGGRLRVECPSGLLNDVLQELPLMQAVKYLDLSGTPLPDSMDLSGFKSLKQLALGETDRVNIGKCIFPESLQELVSYEEASPVPGVYCSVSGSAAFDKAVQSLAFRVPDMVIVKQGVFWMGSKRGALNALNDEFPRHKVSLSDFAIGRQPVTVADFACFVAETAYVTSAEQEGWSFSAMKIKKGSQASIVFGIQLGCNWRYDEYGDLRTDSLQCCPVAHISWEDAVAYCAWLSQKTGRNYQLPTEAQWEYAAMGGHRSPKDEEDIHYAPYVYSGSDNLAEVGIFADNSVGIAPLVDQSTVDSRKPNSLGLYDMSGNVWEWCEDFYHPSFYQEDSASEVNPACTDSASSARVMRGGSWYYPERDCRLARRNRSVPGLRFNALGFRLCAVL